MTLEVFSNLSDSMKVATRPAQGSQSHWDMALRSHQAGASLERRFLAEALQNQPQAPLSAEAGAEHLSIIRSTLCFHFFNLQMIRSCQNLELLHCQSDYLLLKMSFLLEIKKKNPS